MSTASSASPGTSSPSYRDIIAPPSFTASDMVATGVLTNNLKHAIPTSSYQAAQDPSHNSNNPNNMIGTNDNEITSIIDVFYTTNDKAATIGLPHRDPSDGHHSYNMNPFFSKTSYNIKDMTLDYSSNLNDDKDGTNQPDLTAFMIYITHVLVIITRCVQDKNPHYIPSTIRTIRVFA
jgi:hypothetical protein